MITQFEVSEFKTSYCDENGIIAGLLKDALSEYFVEPILDVGSGMGDITALAFPRKRVIHLDVLDYAEHPLPPLHNRILGDFYDFTPSGAVPGTILFCHVLQFLDADPALLSRKLLSLAPLYAVTVTNNNDGFMAELLAWVRSNFREANPEVEVPNFPQRYTGQLEVPFVGTLQCDDYGVLADQIIYLMDATPSAAERARLENYLARELPSPVLPINQKIKVFQKL